MGRKAAVEVGKRAGPTSIRRNSAVQVRDHSAYDVVDYSLSPFLRGACLRLAMIRPAPGARSSHSAASNYVFDSQLVVECHPGVSRLTRHGVSHEIESAIRPTLFAA